MGRVAVVDADRCKPKDCTRPCISFCPMVRSRIEAIKMDEERGLPLIVEELCSGCGICVKKCPFHAIKVMNIPEELEGECIHRYGPNSFKLYRLPIPKRGLITGLIGKNGIGKTTALRILSGEVKPNLGEWSSPPSWDAIIRRFRGSLLQNYFRDLSMGKLKIIVKPQNLLDLFPDMALKASQLLKALDVTSGSEEILDALDVTGIMDKSLNILSGGELQRVALALSICREGDVYIFDEPSSHLDVYQRIRASKALRSLVDYGKTVVVSEHDLVMLDYLSDQVCLLYGEPGVYGIVSHVHSARQGVNIYLDGYIPDENVRFSRDEIRFQSATLKVRDKPPGISWPEMEFSYDGFSLKVNGGDVRSGEIIVVLGPNGIGKTTFIKLIAGLLRCRGVRPPAMGFRVSYKPQHIYSRFDGTAGELLSRVEVAPNLRDVYQERVFEPLGLSPLLDKRMDQLSGGELQKIAVAACILRDADIYLIDEPSAYLDVEERLTASKVIREIVEERRRYAFVVEHDLTAAQFLADAVMIFHGSPGLEGRADQPTSFSEGANMFLKGMDVTFRRDPDTGRLRANKPGSRIDRVQRGRGEYYAISPPNP
ncbi:MAG: ribosome biogenesis/translation initiation ATPase RLI [Candidatus Bathyarchaeia archaeon]